MSIVKVHGCTLLLLGCLLGVAFCCDCSQDAWAPPTTTGPTTMHIEANALINFPGLALGNNQIPVQAKGTLIIDLEAHAIQRSPLRSQYHGSVHLDISNISKDFTFAKLETDVSGQYEGNPNQSYSAFFDSLLPTFQEIMRTWPTTRP